MRWFFRNKDIVCGCSFIDRVRMLEWVMMYLRKEDFRGIGLGIGAGWGRS